jgi:RimJ/RimL family protein N-acetyltransferase
MSDVEAALSIFGDGEVARWLTPAMNRIPDMAAMQHLVPDGSRTAQQSSHRLGRWKVNDLAIGHTVGAVSLLSLPPDSIDSEISVQITRGWWGNGYAGEAGDAIAHCPLRRQRRGLVGWGPVSSGRGMIASSGKDTDARTVESHR